MLAAWEGRDGGEEPCAVTEDSEQGQLAAQAMHHRNMALLKHPQRGTEQIKEFPGALGWLTGQKHVLEIVT